MKNFICHQIKSALIKQKIKLSKKNHIFNQIIFSPSHYKQFFLKPSVAKSFLIELEKKSVLKPKSDNIARLIDWQDTKVLWSTNEFQLKSYLKEKFNIIHWLKPQICGFVVHENAIDFQGFSINCYKNDVIETRLIFLVWNPLCWVSKTGFIKRKSIKTLAAATERRRRRYRPQRKF